MPTQKPLTVIFGFLNATRLVIKALRVGKSPNHPRSSESSKQFPSHLTQSHILTKIILLAIRSQLSKTLKLACCPFHIFTSFSYTNQEKEHEGSIKPHKLLYLSYYWSSLVLGDELPSESYKLFKLGNTIWSRRTAWDYSSRANPQPMRHKSRKAI